MVHCRTGHRPPATLAHCTACKVRDVVAGHVAAWATQDLTSQTLTTRLYFDAGAVLTDRLQASAWALRDELRRQVDLGAVPRDHGIVLALAEMLFDGADVHPDMSTLWRSL